ncbi:MAG: hypothetical protein MZV70_58745 [Desulfobacterales bacterium]|nr:hypothetical protein [Desulfobacterales bacterium]
MPIREERRELKVSSGPARQLHQLLLPGDEGWCASVLRGRTVPGQGQPAHQPAAPSRSTG